MSPPPPFRARGNNLSLALLQIWCSGARLEVPLRRTVWLCVCFIGNPLKTASPAKSCAPKGQRFTNIPVFGWNMFNSFSFFPTTMEVDRRVLEETTIPPLETDFHVWTKKKLAFRASDMTATAHKRLLQDLDATEIGGLLSWQLPEEITHVTQYRCLAKHLQVRSKKRGGGSMLLLPCLLEPKRDVSLCWSRSIELNAWCVYTVCVCVCCVVVPSATTITTAVPGALAEQAWPCFSFLLAN